MNKQVLVIALGWALQTLTVQAAEPIIQPSDRPKPNAVQTAPRAKTNTDDRRATAATARRTGIEQGKVREVFGPMDRTGMTRRGKPAPRSIIEPQDRPRGVVQPNDKPAYGVQPQDRPAKIIDPEDVPRQLMGPGHRSGLIKPTDRPRRDNEKTTPLVLAGRSRTVRSTYPTSPSATRRPQRERWRALAEEFALGYLGNVVTKLARPRARTSSQLGSP
jgi:hypothetical protein